MTPTSTQAGPSTLPHAQYPHELKLAAADLVSSLHLTHGKAQIATMWATEMKDALGGVGASMNAIVGEGWLEGEQASQQFFPFPPRHSWVYDSTRRRWLTVIDAFRVAPPNAPAVATFAADASERLPAALDQLEGWVEVILALLRCVTSPCQDS